MNRLGTWCVAAAFAVALGSSGCALLVGGAVAGGAAGAVSSAKESEHESHAPMTYAGTVLANVFYFPAKVVFAAGGGLTSGAAYLVTLGNTHASGRIWDAAVDGDYVVTPDMIEGEKPVHFVG